MADVELSCSIAGTTSLSASVSGVHVPFSTTIEAESTVDGGIDVTKALSCSIAAQSALASVLAQTVQIVNPLTGETDIAPGEEIAFNFLSTQAESFQEDFEGASLPDWIELCTPTNGYSHANWNSGADNWDHYQDGADKVLRAQGRATAITSAPWRSALHTGFVDVVCRVRWYTGAIAGIFHRFRQDSYGKGHQSGVRGYAAEIDSGGLRLLWYNDGSRNIEQTVSFSPSNGTWYWIKLRCWGQWNMWAQAKYWTGNREDEPSSWSTSIQSQGISDTRSNRWKGSGMRSHAGTAYFDKFEIEGQLDPGYTDRLTAEVNGEEYATIPDRPDLNMRIEPFTRWETFGSYTIRHPELKDWRCSLVPRFAFDSDRAQTVTVKWDGVALKTWTFENLNFPENPPLGAGNGDPSRSQGFHLIGTNDVEPAGLVFEFTVNNFRAFIGSQVFSYPIAPIMWRGNFEEFEFFVYSPFHVPVDGRYIIAHPVEIIIPFNVLPGKLIFQDIPISVIPKGEKRALFPFSAIVQGYIRRQFPFSVTPSVEFIYRGRSSGIVSAEFLSRVRGSGVIREVVRDGVIEIHVIDEETFEALADAGITFS
jgi:hypothetical protein